MFALPATFVACLLMPYLALSAYCAEPTRDQLSRDFAETVAPFLKANCLACHGSERQEAKLDLSEYTSVADVTRAHATWEIVLERLAAKEMPPEEAKRQPAAAESAAVVEWIRALRRYDANQNAGDPGDVLARRLSNSEYNYTIRDLTLVDIRPTKTFPVDPANEAGFDNSGESLTMSPALLQKYLGAARRVAEHLVLTPTDVSFAPHPAVTDTDRDKYCVKRIVEFYNSQPTELSQYFFACWQFQNQNDRSLKELAAEAAISARYTARVWDLISEKDAVGPIAMLQEMFRALPHGAEAASTLAQCDKLRDYVLDIRTRLSPQFDNLYIEGNHKGSQPFVLWKNGQYASHRRSFDRNALYVDGDDPPEGAPRELVLPNNEAEQAKHVASIERFCSTFPDAFYISERGRDYLGVAREQQEKGRLLSAGFHSMMGYYRDDRPLYELVLDENGRRDLDRLWQELDFVASAPARQYVGFLWFERTDSRYMRDPVFDFARAEDKNAASEAMIKKLAEVYLEKARESGGSDIAIKAIEDYFANMNAQLRWVETQRLKSEPVHLRWALRYAERAWRRPLSQAEEREVHGFYKLLREEDRLGHEEAIRDVVVSILMSPHFLYRVDLVSQGDGTRPLTKLELASRLSYFLWATLPDDELLSVVNSTKYDGRPGPSRGGNIETSRTLQGHSTVVEQAKRMLNDERIRGLATEFAANWLDIRRFEEHNSVDRDRFPEFNDELRQAMFEEPIQFFVDLVRNDRSVLELLDANYTLVNPALAKHYDIENLDFGAKRWVRVDDAHRFGRGGLLPMSVFLTKNAPGLRTSPVKRGYWVVRRLLGERIPPPPPNVPELPADESKLGDLTLREMLASHRDNKSCAGCHDRIDSIGLAFEGYGPVGERRDLDLGGRPVEMTAMFPGGSEGSGVDGLRRYLLEDRQQEFIENLCRKLLSYALGRTLMLSDEPLLATMQSNLKADNYRFSSVIESIVTSRQFLYKRGGEQLVKDM
ncbi:MAG: DUF1592 domain-containing protein [Planctomycetes bacterium]|nr:DUF1592 domain-containing protein [Planctomycetota bacterium]